MQTELEAHPARPPMLRSIFRRAAAAVVLVLAAAIAIKIVIGFVMAIFWTIVAVAVVVAILWALKTIIW